MLRLQPDRVRIAVSALGWDRLVVHEQQCRRRAPVALFETLAQPVDPLLVEDARMLASGGRGDPKGPASGYSSAINSPNAGRPANETWKP